MIPLALLVDHLASHNSRHLGLDAVPQCQRGGEALARHALLHQAQIVVIDRAVLALTGHRRRVDNVAGLAGEEVSERACARLGRKDSLVGAMERSRLGGCV